MKFLRGRSIPRPRGENQRAQINLIKNSYDLPRSNKFRHVTTLDSPCEQFAALSQPPIDQPGLSLKTNSTIGLPFHESKNETAAARTGRRHGAQQI